MWRAANNALYIGSLDSPEVTRVMPARPGSVMWRRVPGALKCCVYQDGVLLAQRFSLANRRFIGEATTLLDQLGYAAPSIEARFRVSSDGRVVVAQSGDFSRVRLLWINRSGEQVGELAGCGRNFAATPLASRRPGGVPAPRPADRQS